MELKMNNVEKYEGTCMPFKKRTPIYEFNKGKICKTHNCENKARIKGLCINCYNQPRQTKYNEQKR